MNSGISPYNSFTAKEFNYLLHLYIPLCQTHLHRQIDTPCRQETQCHKIVHPMTKFHKHSLLNLPFSPQHIKFNNAFANFCQLIRNMLLPCKRVYLSGKVCLKDRANVSSRRNMQHSYHI